MKRLPVAACIIVSALALRASGVENLLPAPEPPNPFGLMLSAPGLAVEKRVQLARELGAAFYRPLAIFTGRWQGRDPECDAALKAGFPLVLTVRNGNGPGEPSAPPEDIVAYKNTIRSVMTVYRPAVLVVENEENSRLFYTGTPAEYATELRAAADVARQMGVPCTNGGLVSALVALLTYDDYMQRGETAKARSFALRAFDTQQRAMLGSPKAREALAKGKELIEAYRTAGIDYVNFHWYIADPSALEEAVAFLKTQPGLPLLTNEIGQHDLSPVTVRNLMAKVLDLDLPYAVWYSIDSPQAKALVGPGGTIRENGRAYRDFIYGRSHQ